MVSDSPAGARLARNWHEARRKALEVVYRRTAVENRVSAGSRRFSRRFSVRFDHRTARVQARSKVNVTDPPTSVAVRTVWPLTTLVAHFCVTNALPGR